MSTVTTPIYLIKEPSPACTTFEDKINSSIDSITSAALEALSPPIQELASRPISKAFNSIQYFIHHNTNQKIADTLSPLLKATEEHITEICRDSVHNSLEFSSKSSANSSKQAVRQTFSGCENAKNCISDSINSSSEQSSNSSSEQSINSSLYDSKKSLYKYMHDLFNSFKF